MKKQLIIATLYTTCTALLLGVGYPLLVTGIAQLIMRDKANGSLVREKDRIVGSALIGQPFTGSGYFHSRPSAAGTGYDAKASSGSNFGPSNKLLVDRVAASVLAEQDGAAVPIDLVTASASGLDPDITPAAALYQVGRVAKETKLSSTDVEQLVRQHITPRQFGLLGEPRVNVLALNLDLDRMRQEQR